MPDFRRYSPGDPPTFSASQVNSWTDAAADYIRRKAGKVAAPPLANPVYPANTVLVRNDTNGSLPEFSVLALGRGQQSEPLVSPTDFPLDFQRRPPFAGVAPISTTDPFVVTLEPLADGQIGRAVLDGLVVCEVQFNANELTGVSQPARARPIIGSTFRLKAACDGPAKIIWRAQTNPNSICVVQLGPGHHPPPWCGNHYSVDPVDLLNFEEVVGFSSEKYGLYKVIGSVTEFGTDAFDCVPLPVIVHAGIEAVVRPFAAPLAHLPAWFGAKAALWYFDRNDVPIGALTKFLPLVKGKLDDAQEPGGDWFPEFTGGPSFDSWSVHYAGKVSTTVKFPIGINQPVSEGGHIAWVVKWSVDSGAAGHDDHWGGQMFVDGFNFLANQEAAGSGGGPGGTYILYESAGFCACCDPDTPDADPLPPGADLPFPQERPFATPTADPDTTEFTVGTSVAMTANPTGGRNSPTAVYTGFTWYANGSPVSAVEDPTITFTDAGEYLLEVYFQDDDDPPVQGYGSYAVTVRPNPVRSINATGDGLITDRLVRADATGGAVVYTLPPAADFLSGEELTVLKVDVSGNAVITTPFAGDTLNGAGAGIGRTTQYTLVRVRRVSATAWETTG